MSENHSTIMQKSALSCVKCAKCIPTCTIYSINRDEVTAPRGYLDLVSAYAEGKLKMDMEFKDSIESCFLCTTCVTQCPISLPIDVVIERARVDIAQKYGIPLYKRIAFYLLGNRKVLNILFSFGFYFNPCLFKTSNGHKKLRFVPSRFRDLLDGRVIAPLLSKSFLQRYSGWQRINNTIKGYTSDSKPLQKVGIYIGCLSNYNYIDVGISLVKILQRLDIDVFIPNKQECCGAPAFFSGDIRNTTRLIKKNLDYFMTFIHEIDVVLIPEATCASMLKLDWLHALEIETEVFGMDNTEYIQKLDILTKKTFMASEWLYKHTRLMDLLKNFPIDKNIDKVITYHDPCHAKKTLKIFQEPRHLLSNFHIVEMKDSNVCCGFGGVTIQSEKYHLAKHIGDNKALNIANSGANVVSAECSACRMQINDSLERNNVQVEFKHPLELIAQNLGL
ncbi:(Fe-S)-binding protein [Helicobacter muridarum]|uniref:Glycolate oxidase iron-sulfur subunit n=1 Tax=Helicobacter muridarum TaxID=216 RepID=A0A377PUS1_9HELI|nr:(Fe-S)-binding protein [Helicobacter muridarum]TLE01158.1 (Fe-S)-binding protein [Helicobacter muridarum]STQ86031.1 ferredoxin-type oxidoreductase [Helicobacter muridarum]